MNERAQRSAAISVIVPTHNERQHVRAFLATLHPSIELIVVDAGEDGTVEG